VSRVLSSLDSGEYLIAVNHGGSMCRRERSHAVRGRAKSGEELILWPTLGPTS
jgi:hypothetical protein